MNLWREKFMLFLPFGFFLFGMGNAQNDSEYFTAESFPKIIYASKENQSISDELSKHLSNWFDEDFSIEVLNEGFFYEEGIFLIIDADSFDQKEECFEIKSVVGRIFISAQDSNSLEYAIYTFLEELGLRQYVPGEIYYPSLEKLRFSKQFSKTYKPDFQWRAILYPAAYEEGFRKWHKLDWHQEDFGIWGHSFDKLISPKRYFENYPEYFAFYEGSRRYESLCMTNEQGIMLAKFALDSLIDLKPNRRFYSISQNDDVVYCECEHCRALLKRHQVPSGPLYHFVNRLASSHPEKEFVTLAYLHTAAAPSDIPPAPNVHSFYCPIEMNRGLGLRSDPRSAYIRNRMSGWREFNANLMVWDYTVNFSHFLSPFPNFHTLQDNARYYKENGVKGLFLQGYADVPGDFSEWRQYQLAKLLWDTEVIVEEMKEEFFRYYYGPAADALISYLSVLEEAQLKSGGLLDIYDSPVQKTKTYLSPEIMTQLDELLIDAEDAVYDKEVFANRVRKVRMGLEYSYFEQAKFYGKSLHGMFVFENGKWQVRKGLKERVEEFVSYCEENGIYELGEGGPSPEKYLKDWLEIADQSLVFHKGQGQEGYWHTAPAEEYRAKGFGALVDGLRGTKDFHIGWTGWYGEDAEIVLDIQGIRVSKIEIGFLEDQRHWIFLPKKVKVEVQRNGQWILLEEKDLPDLTENLIVNRNQIQFNFKKSINFDAIKIKAIGIPELPDWRFRKGKKPLMMIDEVILD